MDRFFRLSVIVNCKECHEFFTKVIQKGGVAAYHVIEESFLQGIRIKVLY